MCFSLRRVTVDDAEKVFTWRNDPWIVSLSSSQKSVSWQEHINWFEKRINDSENIFLIIQTAEGIDCGVSRISRTSIKKAEINIYLLKDFTGKGLGTAAIQSSCSLAFEEWPIQEIYAQIRQDNFPSLSSFSKVGFIKQKSTLNLLAEHVIMVLYKDVLPFPKDN
jgi:spore coat polysaccharide biosynthesis protein SpsF